MDMKLEVVVVPVSDVDRAKEFYEKRCGFNVDVDDSPNPKFRIVQLTPPGSGCSVTIGTGIALMEPGSLKGLPANPVSVLPESVVVGEAILHQDVLLNFGHGVELLLVVVSKADVLHSFSKAGA